MIKLTKSIVPQMLLALAATVAPMCAHAQNPFMNVDRIDVQFNQPQQGNNNQQQGNQNQQQGGSNQRGNSNPIVGSWHQVSQDQNGGVTHVFYIYGKDGSFQYTSIEQGGAPGANGSRLQFWGRYQIQPAGNGRYLVKTQIAGRAPMQSCAQGMGCQSLGPMPTPMQAYYQFQGDMMQSTDGTNAQRSEVPPALMQKIAATIYMQAPPSAAPSVPAQSPSASTGGGTRYVSPNYHVPGQGGTCDDLQVSRVCTINGGSTYRNQATGCLVCTN